MNKVSIPLFCSMMVILSSCNAQKPSSEIATSIYYPMSDSHIEKSDQALITVDYLMGKFDPAQHQEFMLIPPKYRDEELRYIRKDVFQSFVLMYEAAAKEGIFLKIRSATRNFENQKRIWENKWTGKTILEDNINAAADIKDDLKRAKKEQLEKALKTLLWIAVIDKFQHWVYLHPNHTAVERSARWNSLITEFSSTIVDWGGYESVKARMWQNQLHLFEVPFYYIEYGMAQLGAIAVWRNYKNNPEKALDAYEAALRLGYTKSIPEIYKTAGIEFNFSQEYVNELAAFVKGELKKLG